MAKFKTEKEFIYDLLHEFAADLIASRRKNIKDQKAVASKKLLRSFEFQILQATTGQTAAALIAFEERGRFLDMKRVNRKDKMIPVNEIKNWIQEVGLDSFKRLPKKGTGAPGGDKILNALAWGISKKIQQKGRYKKARRSLQKGTEAQIINLIEELREGWKDRTIEQIKESLKNGS